MFDHFVGLVLEGLILEAKFGDDPLHGLAKNSHMDMFFKKGFLKILAKFTGWHCRCFPVNFVKFFGTTSL